MPTMTTEVQQVLRGGAQIFFSNPNDINAGATAILTNLLNTYQNALLNDADTTNTPVSIYNPIL